MFKLFERQPNWALKQLVQETDQPAVCLFFLLCFFLVPYWTLERPAPPRPAPPKKQQILVYLSFSFGIHTYICIKLSWYLRSLFLLQQFLKEILNELCVYNKRGANQGTYELKPEYKKSVEDTSAE